MSVERCRVAHRGSGSQGNDLRSRLDLPSTGDSFVFVDEVKLFEIINNLVSNALKFTPRGIVELVVGLSVPSASALPLATLDIRVSDSGHGIAENELDKVFLPFYQRNHAGDSTSRGTGLGLSIVKQLVQAWAAKYKCRVRLAKAARSSSPSPSHSPPQKSCRS